MRQAVQRSETLEAMEKLNLPDEAVIYSNDKDIIESHSDRSARSLPSKYNASTKQSNVNYESEIREMEKSLRRREGLIVIFNFTRRDYLPSKEELQTALPLQIVATLHDGVIYQIKPRPATRMAR